MKPWAWVRRPSGRVWHMAHDFTYEPLPGGGQIRMATIHCRHDTLPAAPISADEPLPPDGIPPGDRACTRCATILKRRVDHYAGLLADLPTTPPPRSPRP